MVVRGRVQHPRALGLLVLGVLAVIVALATAWRGAGEVSGLHQRTIVVFVIAVVAGELVRLRMPSRREAAPLASAAALALAFVGDIAGEATFDVDAAVVVLVVGSGLAFAGIVRQAQGRPVRADQMAARLVGVGLAAWLARTASPGGVTLWDLARDGGAPLALVAAGMLSVATVGLAVEIALSSAVRSERHRTAWTSALRDEIGEVAPLTYAVVTTGPLVALMAPVLGLLALPVALFPLAITYVAVDRATRNRETYRQTIATLSSLTEAGGYTPVGHAERVATASVRIGRVLGMSARELRDVEYAALLHDLGQISLRDPIPGGATVRAAPSDQREIAAEGARIIRRASGLEDVAALVEATPTAYRLVRELGQDVAFASRIIKVANAYDDLTGGHTSAEEVEAALERIQLGLGYEYDPDVVTALAVVTSATAPARVGSRAS
jgi:predicted aconitase with swiveling domain